MVVCGGSLGSPESQGRGLLVHVKITRSIALLAAEARTSVSNKPEALGSTPDINFSIEASRATNFLSARVLFVK
jgi:hypothetical protein